MHQEGRMSSSLQRRVKNLEATMGGKAESNRLKIVMGYIRKCCKSGAGVLLGWCRV